MGTDGSTHPLQHVGADLPEHVLLSGIPGGGTSQYPVVEVVKAKHRGSLQARKMGQQMFPLQELVIRPSKNEPGSPLN
jgi:hypothetical protein